MQYEIDYDKSSVGYGSLTVNKTSDYDAILDGEIGDVIFAHANSTVYITAVSPLVLRGKLSRDAAPLSYCRFVVDGSEVGSLWNPFDKTRAVPLMPGSHRLEITTKNNAFAHTYWFIAGVKDIGKPAEIQQSNEEQPAKRGRKRKDNHED